MCTLFCVCPPTVESLFPLVLLMSCNQIPLAFKVWFSWNPSSRCWTSMLGSLTWGSEPSLQWVDLCGTSFLQFVSHPPSTYGIWLYCDCALPTVSMWLLLCLWMWGIFFGKFQCLPVNDCSAVSCDSGVLTWGSESTSFYSTILNPHPSRGFLTTVPPGKSQETHFWYLICFILPVHLLQAFVCLFALLRCWKLCEDRDSYIYLCGSHRAKPSWTITNKNK